MAIGLDVLAGPLGDQGRCDDGTIMPESSDLAMQAIACRPRFIAKQQLLELASQLVCQPLYCVWCVLDFTEKPDFALAALFR